MSRPDIVSMDQLTDYTKIEKEFGSIALGHPVFEEPKLPKKILMDGENESHWSQLAEFMNFGPKKME